MDLHAPAPPSASDDGYNLADLPAPPADAPAVNGNGDGAHAEDNGDAASAVEAEPTGKKKGEKAKKEKAKAKEKSGGGLGGFFKKRAEAAPAAAASAAEGGATQPPVPEDAAERKKKRRRRKAARLAVPAWGVSLIMHVAILFTLAAVTFSSTEAARKILKIDSAMVANPGGADELVKVYAEPSNAPRDQAVGGGGGPAGGGGGGGSGAFGGIGTGAPSATPAVNGGGGGINEKNGLPGVKMIANVSGLNLLPSAGSIGVDLGSGGMIRGDVAYDAKDIGAALDQLAREILRHLGEHKLTVVWVFDESESMKDDQKTVRQKFDRVSSELKINAEGAAKSKKESTPPLNHVIIGFGKDVHPEISKPTADIDQIGRAIDKLRIDDTGIENTMHTLGAVIEEYSKLINKDRRLLIVLVTDESGDDGAYVEEVHQMAVQRKVPIYIIGRQSLFGYDRAHLQYIDPVTKDVYWPTIKRGPETADIELLQWDGLHDRWDEQPSGFAPYELARLSKDTGGIYFLLPSEENMRVRQREKAYEIKDLKEYIPEYEGRAQYVAERNKSEFRRNLYDVIQATKDFPFRRHFPVDPALLVPACQEAGELSNVRFQQLERIEKQLRGLSRLRDREPEKRWQAHYDLMLAQIIAYEVKSYEYGACLAEMAKKPPKPTKMPTPELVVEWVIDHSKERKAAKEKTEKKYVEAEKLLKEVIAKHPRTPWADLAQDELNRGFGCQRNEWHHNPKYEERAKLVPKY